MSNSVKSSVIAVSITIIISVFVVLYSLWQKRSQPVVELETPIEVLCISEKGDTVARFQTLDTPKIWSSGGVTCAHGFKDLKTGLMVELRTRDGVIVVCQ